MKIYSNYYYIGSIHYVVSVLSGACRWPLPEDDGGIKRMLDIGCWPGNSTAVLRERYPHAEILGVDSSPDMIEAARKAYPDIDFQLCDVSTQLNELPGDFDVVFSNAWTSACCASSACRTRRSPRPCSTPARRINTARSSRSPWRRSRSPRSAWRSAAWSSRTRP